MQCGSGPRSRTRPPCRGTVPNSSFACLRNDLICRFAGHPASLARRPAPPAPRLVQVGGARLAPEVARRAEPVLGGTLQQVFGMAEGLLNYTRPDDPDDIKIETQGRPMRPDDEILVVDASDNPAPPGEMGALLTRGPYAPRGYYRAAEHNARAFTPDGWYRTGDVVRLHPSGNLVVEGRDKDLINRGGEKISAEEVENLIYRLPGVARVASVAKADPDLGERVCAMVVVEPGAHLSLESVRAALTAMQVARYKLPEDQVVGGRPGGDRVARFGALESGGHPVVNFID
ncbi:AMP-binding protein [Streptomyces sp. GESEQ-4]|uniref:AMP-binding protein n=1 Tax=Streptomyces sp. GESEQ-4 TaxID=2812655 RepID=UPI0027DD15B0|nr:AMP-binding protein [Streptomyces sp. GESEQ-4]